MPAHFWVAFVALFLSVYGFGHYYFLRHAIPALSPSRRVRLALVAVSVGLALSFLGGRFLERWRICLASKALVLGRLGVGWRWCSTRSWPRSSPTSSAWADRRLHFVPAWAAPKRVVVGCSLAVVALVAAGFANAGPRGRAPCRYPWRSGRRPHQAHRRRRLRHPPGDHRRQAALLPDSSRPSTRSSPTSSCSPATSSTRTSARSSPRTWRHAARPEAALRRLRHHRQPRVHRRGGRRGPPTSRSTACGCCATRPWRSARPAKRTSIAGRSCSRAATT